MPLRGFGELLRQVDARGVQQTFRYDALGRQTQREVPAKGACNVNSSPMITASELGTRCNIATVDRFFYDGVVDAQGTVGSAEARGLPSGHQRDFVHGADPDPITTRTERGVADYFDTHGRLIERRTRQNVSQPVLANLGPNSGQRHYSHRWAYDTRFGRVLAESWPNGVGRSFVYSSIGAVEAELGLGDAMPLTLREVREVNALGQATVEWLGAPGQHGALLIQRSQTQATGEMESIQYARRAMGGATPATIWHETYRYDGWGNLIRRGQSQPDLPAQGGSFSQFERYQYDALHRLTQSTLTTNGASAPAVSLAYDRVGNLLKKTDFSRDLGNAYSYPAANGVQPNAVQSVALAGGSSNTQNYRYDASGNVVCQFLLNNTVRSCTDLDAFRAYYNHNQQPVYQRRTLVHSVNGSLYSDAWFTYGADQQPARQWGFEGTPDCINQPAERGCLRHHRIYLDRYEDTVGSFRHFDGGERLYRSRAYVGDYLIATRGRYGELELSFLLRDRLGSVVGVEGVTLLNRNIAEMRGETRHSFDAYGTPRSNFKRDGSLWTEQPRWSSPTRTQQGFTGHERLSGLQLIHMRGRVFDPQLGRFHGVDPIIQFPLSSQGLNPYSYILNNPLAGVDPTGYAACSVEDSKSCLEEGTNQVYDDDGNYLGKVNVKDGVYTFAPTKAGWTYRNGAETSASPDRTNGEQSSPDLGAVGTRSTQESIGSGLRGLPISLGVDPNSDRSPDQQAATLVPGVGLAQCASGVVKCEASEFAIQAGAAALGFWGGTTAARLVTGSAAKGASSSVWTLAPVLRGEAIEQVLGQNLPRTFPVIDKFSNGLATSIKSLDLSARTYQNPAAITRRLQRYVESLASFEGAALGTTVVGSARGGAAITGRQLQVAIPAGYTMSGGQQAALNAAAAHARSQGLSFVVIRIQ